MHEVEFMVLLWFNIQTVERCFSVVYREDPLSLIPKTFRAKSSTLTLSVMSSYHPFPV